MAAKGEQGSPEIPDGEGSEASVNLLADSLVRNNELLAAMLRQQALEQKAASDRHEQLLMALLHDSNGGRTGPQDANDVINGAITGLRPKKQPDPNKPPTLDSSISLDDFDGWVRIWNDYAICFDFDSLPGAQQLARLRSFMSPEMRSELIHGVGISDTDNLSPVDLLKRIRDYLRGRRNVAIDRVEFEERRQGMDESFDDFYVALRKKAANADLCSHCFDTRLATCIMARIKDQETRKKLLAIQPFPALQQVVDLCRSEESARKNNEIISNEAKVAAVKSSHSKAPPKAGQSKPRSPVNSNVKCRNCGQIWHGTREKCPAFQSKCHGCSKIGHFKEFCRSTRREQGYPAASGSKAQVRPIRINTANAHDARKAPTIQVDIYSERGRPLCCCEVVPDSGAEGTVASVEMMSKLGIHQRMLMPVNQGFLTSADEKSLYCIVSSPQRAPMGLVSTGDEYCRVGDEALSGIERLEKVVDDFNLYDDDFPGHVKHVWETLQRCREKKITLNKAKWQFAQPEVKFVGYIVGRDGIKPDPKKLSALKEFPVPTNVSQLRSFFGVLNQLTLFSPEIERKAEPLRSLLSVKNEFLWSANHDEAFKTVKDAITEFQVLAHFDPKLPTVLRTDASRLKGLGFVLMQRHGNKNRIIECGSRFLTGAETRYAVIELEMLAVVWAVKKCYVYLQGLPDVEIVVDHNPLVPLLNNYTVADISNPRLQRLKEKLSGYVYHAVWRPGKDNVIADALSRNPVDKAEADDEVLEEDISSVSIGALRIAAAENLTESQTLSDPLIDEITTAAKSDSCYQQLRAAILNGFPPDSMDRYVAQFYKLRDDLSMHDELIVLGHRIVVPGVMRKDILARLHRSHQGVEKTKRRARQCVFWPGINSDIENLVKDCPECRLNRPSQRAEPYNSDPLPQWVFQEVGVDLFEHAGNHYLVYVDRLSGWPVLGAYYRRCPSARDVIRLIRGFFVNMGVPIKLRSDNGPQFAATAFKAFLKRWGVHHVTSTPHYPQSNGLAECAVKSVKALVIKATKGGNLDDEEFDMGLLEYRNTPRANGVSPAELVFGHPVRSIVPMLARTFAPRWEEIKAKAEDGFDRERLKAAMYYNRGTRFLSPLKVGDQVSVQSAATKKWDRIGVVVGIGRHRDYHIKFPSGQVLWRNRRFLHKCSEEREEGNLPTTVTTTLNADMPGTSIELQIPRRSQRKHKSPTRFQGGR